GAGTRGADDVRLQLDELGGEGGKLLNAPLRIPALHGQVLALDVAALPQDVDEDVLADRLAGPRWRARDQHPEPVDSPRRPRRLCLGGERRGEHGDSSSEKRAPARHWITSSARASTAGGMVRPRAFAVLRLITSSNFVGCSTGRSAGLAPFKTLST